MVGLSMQLIHASEDGTLFYEAACLQGKLCIYRHNDMDHLEELLQACPATCRKLVIADSLFSMDGEALLAPELYSCHGYHLILHAPAFPEVLMSSQVTLQTFMDWLS
jgi:7-keto-8-aminopelargonate synthetase-like enzyme